MTGYTRSLVDECHGRGIRVIHDGVYNRAIETAPLTQIDYTYWYYKDNPDEPGNRFGPKYDYEHRDDNLGIWPARQHAAMRSYSGSTNFTLTVCVSMPLT